jgi:predicted nucleic acid-binding protein
LRTLIDTNIFIHREDYGVVPKELQELMKVLTTLKAEVLVYPKSVRELENDANVERRKISLSKINTYPVLDSPPDPSLDIFFLEKVGASENSHDQVDNFMLYAVYRDSVSYLISEDKEVHKKALRVGLRDRVLSFQEANCSFKEFLPKEKLEHPPALREEFVYNLNVADPFFDSLKKEYPDFDKWFKKISTEGRKCYVHFQGNAISALLIRKVENEAIPTSSPLPMKKRLKLSILKEGKKGLP